VRLNAVFNVVSAFWMMNDAARSPKREETFLFSWNDEWKWNRLVTCCQPRSLRPTFSCGSLDVLSIQDWVGCPLFVSRFVRRLSLLWCRRCLNVDHDSIPISWFVPFTYLRTDSRFLTLY
jgi:hypothetical protein